MTILKWNDPMTEWDLFKNEMNRVFEHPYTRQSIARQTSVFPLLNIYEDTERLYITAELPGVADNDLDISIDAESFQVIGNRKVDVALKDGHYHRREREGGRFSKKVVLPIRISTNEALAELKNGVLKVTLPKAEEVKPKKIHVTVE